jgi:hemoglobin
MDRTALLILCLALGASCASGAAAQKADAPVTAPAAQSAGGGGTTSTAAKKPLFERLGGRPAVEAVVDDFLGRVSQDETINSGFAVSDVPRVRQRLIELVCVGSGGPGTYSGRDMKTAHAGLGITTAQFNALVGHLVGTLDKFKVPEAEKGELLAVLGPMKGAIVEEP